MRALVVDMIKLRLAAKARVLEFVRPNCLYILNCGLMIQVTQP